MIATIIISVVVVLIIGGIVFKLVKNKKEGKHSCSCGCGGCSMKDCCHPNDNK